MQQTKSMHTVSVVMQFIKQLFIQLIVWFVLLINMASGLLESAESKERKQKVKDTPVFGLPTLAAAAPTATKCVHTGRRNL